MDVFLLYVSQQLEVRYKHTFTVIHYTVRMKIQREVPAFIPLVWYWNFPMQAKHPSDKVPFHHSLSTTLQ